MIGFGLGAGPTLRSVAFLALELDPLFRSDPPAERIDAEGRAEVSRIISTGLGRRDITGAVRCRSVLISPGFLAKIGQRRDSTLYQSVLLSWVPIRVASRSAMLARRPMDSRDREIQIIAEEICAQVPGAMLSRTDGSLYLEPTDCRTIAMRIVNRLESHRRGRGAPL